MTEWEVSLCRTYAFIAISSRVRTTFGGSLLDMERSSVTVGVRRVAASVIGGLQTGSWLHKKARTLEKPKCFERTQRHKEYATT